MVITHPDQINAAWVDAALRRAGVLQDGAVASIEIVPAPPRVWWHSVQIRVRYRDGSAGDCPRQLRLTSCGGEGGPFGVSTLRYFGRDYATLADAPLPPCYDAVHEAFPRRYHLLQRDLAETHHSCDDGPPTRAHGQALAASLAALHAHLWGAARCAADPVAEPVHSSIERFAARAGAGLEPLLAAAAPEITPTWARRLPDVFASLAPRYRQRAANGLDLTQLHGDLNPAHLLAPVGADGPLLLAERQPFDGALTRWLGASDLVNAMVPWWDTALRREFETATLHRYHAALCEHGVRNYPLRQLIDDYRLCIVEAIALAVECCRREDDLERLRWLWRRQLRRAFAAYEDLRCDDFWA